MARIAYILLCHKDPEGVIAQARRLTAAGDCLAIHFDGRAPRADYDRIRRALADNPEVVLARRVKCGWGEWSLVQATLNALRAAEAAFPTATHFYMLSGDCRPIKSAAHIHAVLDADEADYIESVDFFTSDWIKTGIKDERLIYRHGLFNERRHKRLFYAALSVQRSLGLRRAIPADLRIMIGSQWWCLRRRTVEWVLEFAHRRPDVMRFFRTTWIPDETFFQTLVRHLVPEREVRARTLTFLMFSDYGMPVTFYNDHYELLLAQDYLFARKISPGARELSARLGALYASGRVDFPISGEGRQLYQFLTQRGRTGQRFAPRAWEVGASIGRGRQLLVLVCKKWHVARRVAERLGHDGGLPSADYLFGEERLVLPDLGGIETGLARRSRHRRAVLRLLFDQSGGERMILCLDPSQLEVLQDLQADRATIRVLEIDCRLSDPYLIGHALRVGLAGPGAPPEVVAQLLPALRHGLAHETERLRDAGFPGYGCLREGAPAAENAAALAGFAGLTPERAAALIDDTLFAD